MSVSRSMLALILLAQISCSDGPSTEAAPGAPKPPPSAGHALVWHDSLAAVLLLNAGLGGMNQPPSSTPTVLWKWTGTRWEVIDSLGPPVRNLAGVAYDSKRNRLVLHGGTYDQNLSYDETWEWSQAGGWQKRAVPGPGVRDHTDMAYDAERARVVLFGGQARIDSFPPDTWSWDGGSWTQVATTGPAPRVHFSMIYDPSGRQLLLFGGGAPTEHTNKGDTWAWNGTGWSQAATASAPRTHARLGRTPNGFIVIGGFPALANGSVLALNGTSWQTVSQPNAPNARYLTALAFDPVRNVTVLFGGGDPGSDKLYGDTWEYSVGGGWRKVE